MSGVGKLDFARLRVEQGIEEGHKHAAGGVLFGQGRIDESEAGARVGLVLCRGLEQGPANSHEEGRGHTFAADIADREHQAAIVQKEKIEQVAAHLAGWLHLRMQMKIAPSGERWK